MSQAIQKADSKSIEFIPYGQQDKIKLSAELVKNFIAIPTKKGATCTDRDAIRFMMLCQAKRINPFEGDAYLIGYDTKTGPAFNLVTAHQTYLKRAELHAEYDGMESGVVVEVDGEEKELKGDFVPKGATLLGGWARVHFKNRRIAAYSKLNLESRLQTYEYEDFKTHETVTKIQGRWEKDPAGMIVKCCEADALRSAFPTMLGGLYHADEIAIPIQAEVVASEAITSRQITDAPQQAASGDDDGDLGPQKQVEKPAHQTTDGSPQERLALLLNASGVSWEQFRRWLEDAGQLKDASSLSSWSEIPKAEAERFLKIKKLADIVKGGQ